MKRKILLSITTLLMIFTLALTGCKKDENLNNATNENQEGAISKTLLDAQSQTNDSYLKTYFDVSFDNDQVSVSEFNTALVKLTGSDEAVIEGELTALSAIKSAMIAANYEELVLSYPTDKAKNSLAKHGIKDTIDDSYLDYLACAIDTGFLSKEDGMLVAKNEALTKAEIEALLMRIAYINGDARNYLSTSDDPAVYAKIDQAWNSFILFDDSTLSDIGRQAVTQKTVTGFNIKNEAYDAKFLPELTLQYGHSDIKHAHQLIGLLNSEGIVAKVQLEPKVSIYEYLLEWGPIPKTTPTYEVKKFSDDLYLTYAVEYDLKLEFETREQMEAFDEVIAKYAKKNEGNEEAKGLIYASWWQPLYSTTVSDMDTDAFNEIGDAIIKNGMYSLHTFYLPKDKDSVVNQLGEYAKPLSIETETRYCNVAFYHYLNGEDYQ